MNENPQQEHRSLLSRRAILQGGTLFLAGASLARDATIELLADEAAASRPRAQIGLVSDLHYAERAPAGTRHYRQTPAKLAEAAQRFQDQKTDAVVALGDLIDAADSLDVEKGYLRRIAKELAAVPGRHDFVLGNHCVYSLTKPEFLEIVGQKRSYYSFDLGGCHFVVLDACFRSDGVPYGRKNANWTDANVPPAELAWLEAELARTSHKTIAFLHQRLDVPPPYGVKNALEVRKVLERSAKVLAVVQGHYHPGDYREIQGIHYCTLAALVEGSGPENNAYSILGILPGDAIRITGFRRQKSYRWPEKIPPVQPQRRTKDCSIGSVRLPWAHGGSPRSGDPRGV